MQKLSVRAILAKDDNVELYEREGYLVAMTDRALVAKLSALTKELFEGRWVPNDEDEAGYAPYLEEQARKCALRKKPVEKVDAKTVEAKMPNGPTDAEKKREGKEVYLLAKMYSGQINVSNIVCGARLLSYRTGAHTEYTAKNPLVVSRISGIAAGSTTVHYTGEELRVGDIEVWVSAIRIGVALPLGKPVRLSESTLLKATRRTDGNANYIGLREQLRRLQNAKLMIETSNAALITSIADGLPEDTEVQAALTTGRLAISISLLGDSSISTPNKKGVHSVHIPTNVRALFGPGLSSWFCADDYYKLKNTTARRLLLLYGRHANPRPFTLQELRDVLGADQANKYFLSAINLAHKELFAAGILLGDKAPVYASHYAADLGGGMLRNTGEKAFAVKLARNSRAADAFVT